MRICMQRMMKIGISEARSAAAQIGTENACQLDIFANILEKVGAYRSHGAEDTRIPDTQPRHLGIVRGKSVLGQGELRRRLDRWRPSQPLSEYLAMFLSATARMLVCYSKCCREDQHCCHFLS